MTAPAEPRRGYSLIEMLCVIVLLAVVIAGLGLLLKETLGIERAQAEHLQRMLQQQALADRFRADVAQAEQAPQQWRHYQAGRHTLILRMKDGRHVLYVWSEGRLQRRVLFGDRQEQASSFPMDADHVAVEFVREGSGPNVLRLRLAAVRQGNPVPGQALEIAAAVGGDWR
jgi:prepilin-type N-terminal cleavage/methylation domain-containing protein